MVKKPLKQYIVSRKIAYTAFEMETTNKSLLDIATEYGFQTYDTFTRAFKREVGITPSEYRKSKCRQVRYDLIGMGTYAPVLLKETPSIQPLLSPESIILYGVPKVEFATGKCTPLPACTESLLSYMRQREHCSYTWLTSASGLAFRLCWNPGQWDMSNSNCTNISLQSPFDIYRSTFQAAGWSCSIIVKEQTPKLDYLEYIRSNLSKGRPVIALGVVGPPEACILTGYQDNGNRLLGWSFFQDSPEFTANTRTDESGYFLISDWWEGSAASAVIALDKKTEIPADREIIQRIHGILTAKSFGAYQAGQNAYDSWANDLQEDAAFEKNSITPRLLNTYFCQADAETMVGEGRYWGAQFFKEMESRHPHISGLCQKAADLFIDISKTVQDMTHIRHGLDQTEESVRLFCHPEIRKEIVSLIQWAKNREKMAISVIEDILSAL